MSELFTIVEPTARSARRDTRTWDEAIAALHANQGKFILIAKNEKHRQLASTIKAGKNKAFADGEYLAVSQKAAEGEGYDILASYVGPKVETETVAPAVVEGTTTAPVEAEATPASDSAYDWS